MNIFERIKTLPLDKRTKGSLFEKISKHLLKEKDTANDYKEISLWNDWKLRGNESDCGIDLVIETHKGEFIAVQCKFHESKINLGSLSTFFTKVQSGIGDIRFSKGIIITSSELGPKAEKELNQIRKNKPIDLIEAQDFKDSNIDWGKITLTQMQEELPHHLKKEPRPHQEEAIKATKEYFKNSNHTRGKLIMACGTGKTFTSLKILESITSKTSTVLFLAPSIALVAQTFREYASQKTDPFVACIVCSDTKAGKNQDDVSYKELPIKPSTNAEDILFAYEKAKDEKKRLIIFSTYQSAIRLKEAQKQGLEEIDLMICDEAHRSVGAMYSLSKSERDSMVGDMGDDALNNFTICHNDEHIKAKKRLYMTATPKVYKEGSKAKAEDKDNDVFSMDDEKVFGEQIYDINFSKAIEQNLLSDYKVIIVALKAEDYASITNNAIVRLKSQNTQLNNALINQEFVCKIIGSYKGLTKQDLITLDSDNQKNNALKDTADKKKARRAINFCRSIEASKSITTAFQTIVDCYIEETKRKADSLKIEIDHIDGSMNSKVRLDKLSNLDSPKDSTCNVLSNAKCLSEGIDVPALDTVVFFDGRSAMVDIIQAVGRVMRKAPDKDIGYIILPIALSEEELSNLDTAVNNTNFKSIWKIIQALRSHDPRLVDESVFKEKIEVSLGSTETPDDEPEKPEEQSLFDITTLQKLADSIYNVMPTKLGDRGYFSNYGRKIASNILPILKPRLKAIFDKNPAILQEFHNSLKTNIHNFISEEEAVDMICSHRITKPIFDTIFKLGINENPINKALNVILNQAEKLGLGDEEIACLKPLYAEVKERAELAVSQKSKQELIKGLYNDFFSNAFKKQSQNLGIVYTPIEIVDFILKMTNDILKKHFNVDYNDPNVKIYDPFTGTGSFITRLLSDENKLISDKALKDKFENGLFAGDIVLLAYYIALVNITQTAQARDNTLLAFKNIALADSLDYLESKSNLGVLPLFKDLEGNSKIKSIIEDEEIRVIVGNPPYSAGAKSQNDNNANLSHPNLEKRVKEAYGDSKSKGLGKTTRDTMIQALYMASDKLKDKGVLGFVVNGGFIYGQSADGVRKALAKQFAHLYILNLRGNTRNYAESKKEGGGVFGNNSQATIAIILLVKDDSVKQSTLHYYDIGDYLSTKEKLAKLSNFQSLDSVPFYTITPNAKGDWINQRSEEFEKLIPLKNENKKNQSIFTLCGIGVTTSRDSFAYNFDTNTLMQSMQRCIETYNKDLEKFNTTHRADFNQRTLGIKKDLYKYLNDDDITTDETKISWSDGLKKIYIKNQKSSLTDSKKLKIALYRPFVKQKIYWDKVWIHRQSQFNQFLPNEKSENLFININQRGGEGFALISKEITDNHFIGDTQVYPLYYYDTLGQRHCAISYYALSLFQKHYKDDTLSEEEIFYYIYALLNHKGYMDKYKSHLSKEAPRIGLSKDFKALSRLGKELAQLHLDYEKGQMHGDILHKDGVLADTKAKDYYNVREMKIEKRESIIYNQNISIVNIPLKAYEYQVAGKSAIEWIVSSYQVKTDKNSLIENNPNLYAGGKYIFELLCRIITMSVKSVNLIEEISKLDFE
ncbi:type ISP restriction/modification enzyme [Campylobacter helveticus]|uniref:type ISP restriction/modification enzyme n=1 Tax=Campylobacter helveticus TaxID=28898 RepID=UPI0022EA472B|nr:type ISP restriction/modification enzyme [Campylobacter helveticus]